MEIVKCLPQREVIKMKYEIWQLPVSHPNKYMHLDWCKKTVDILDYVMVYFGITNEDTDILETLFYIHNEEPPADYHAASMSVSDIVCLIDDVGKRTWWYVDGVGFKEITDIKN